MQRGPSEGARCASKREQPSCPPIPSYGIMPLPGARHGESSRIRRLRAYFLGPYRGNPIALYLNGPSPAADQSQGLSLERCPWERRDAEQGCRGFRREVEKEGLAAEMYSGLRGKEASSRKNGTTEPAAPPKPATPAATAGASASPPPAPAVSESTPPRPGFSAGRRVKLDPPHRTDRVYCSVERASREGFANLLCFML